MRAVGLGGFGTKRLLAPEELARKTLAVTGFQWGRIRGSASGSLFRHDGQSHVTNAQHGCGLLYGGIDSDSVTERAKDFTSAKLSRLRAIHQRTRTRCG